MTAETLGHHDTKKPTPDTGGLDTLDDILDDQTPAPEQENPRHFSAVGHALGRVAGFLQQRAQRMEQRALNNARHETLDAVRARSLGEYVDTTQFLAQTTYADGTPHEENREFVRNRLANERNADHVEALKEYRQRDPNDYIDHLSNLADENNTNESARRFGQQELNREDRIESRREAMDKAGRAVRRVGRVSLNILAAPALVTLGAGILATEAAGRGVRNVAGAIGENVKTHRTERANRKAAAETRKAAEKQRRATEREARATAKQAERDRALEAKRNEAARQARAAAARRQARRTKWNNRKSSATENYRKTVNFSKKQAGRIGHVAKRTHATGKAATEAWKNYNK